MPGYPRSEVVEVDTVSVYHCYARSVRQFLLLGRYTDEAGNVGDRRDWIQELQIKLASLFAIEIGFLAILRNHLHVVLRIRPDIAGTWSDEDVVRRWLTIARIKRMGLCDVPAPSKKRIQQELARPGRVAELRNRLAHPSWWMGTLCESISRRINREEERKGTCWEGRYGCRRLADEVGALLCGIYVDLNLIRAGLARTPEESRYTSAYDRIQARQLLLELEAHLLQSQQKQEQQEEQRQEEQRQEQQQEQQQPASTAPTDPPQDQEADSVEVPSGVLPDAYLAPIYLDESQPVDCEAFRRSVTSCRASDKGFLPITLDEYLALLDATGRVIIEGKKGAIPDHLEPILQRLGIRASVWVAAVENYASWFGSVVGHVEQIKRAAARAGRRWLRGKSHCAALTSNS